MGPPGRIVKSIAVESYPRRWYSETAFKTAPGAVVWSIAMIKRLILPVLLCVMLAACEQEGEQEYTVASGEEFARAVDRINTRSRAETCHIILAADITADKTYFNTTKAKKTIIIRSDTESHALASSGNSGFFFLGVYEGNTLVLESGVRLTASVQFGAVGVDGGALVMRDGAFIEGANNSGVYVDNGTFMMYAGSITGNTAGENGGGVYVYHNPRQYNVYDYVGRFIKTGGGTIDGNMAAEGRAVYIHIEGRPIRQIDTGVGPELDLEAVWTQARAIDIVKAPKMVPGTLYGAY
jgi:hypothetical protein